ncbi:hypothetical protein Scep_013904 [Stephania cephalantha]|uniref:BHLH domain-containing protein n=1 Tax=Stephania cephalantha TaxID=152367 RepID=A0AAP0J237_9MAGN
MCAFSSLFSTFVWPSSIEDQIISTSHNTIDHEYHQNWPSSSPTDDDHHLFMDLDHAQKLSDHDNYTATTSDPTKAKRMNHNASERDRRKKLNTLYSTLRSLLPAVDLSKKLSIPGTVSRVLKYIPEQQKQVERLVQRKEEILSSIAKQGNDHNSNGNLMMTSNQKKCALKQSFTRVSTSLIDDKEVLVQICALKLKRNQLSEVLLNLEREDLQILNASSSATAGNRVFYTLHFQVKDTKRVECELLNEKVKYLFERKDLLL